MKIFTTKQIATLDQYTIEHEPISSLDLMERASLQIANWLIQHISNEKKLQFFVGPGNNGGDALAVARIVADFEYRCEVFICSNGKDLAGSPATNLQRLLEQSKVTVSQINSESEIPESGKNVVIIDGLFGSGLTRPLEGLAAAIVRKINAGGARIISIDIPSGLMGEDNTNNKQENIVHATHTLTFQFPKMSFFFAENEKYVGKWEVLPIGLHADGIAQTETQYHVLSKKEISLLIPPRSRFGHKGTYGHALMIAGSYGKMGAAILASRSCLRAGAGLLTTHIPRLGYNIIQVSVPEAMASIDQSDLIFTEFPELLKFSAVGIGPGLDTHVNSQRGLLSLIEQSKRPIVIDADALNILSEHPDWIKKIPAKSILTPHPGEFSRLVGNTENSFQRISKQREFSQKYNLIMVLKGAYSTISTPDGNLFFNSSGNPGMATAGSGDVLTGIILGLLTQGYQPEHAALAGVYLHGLAGDIAATELSVESLTAGDIIDLMGKAFTELKHTAKP